MAINATDDEYTAQARELIPGAKVDGPREHCGPPGSEAHCTWTAPIWTIHLPEFNMSIDVEAATEDDARAHAGAIDTLASALRKRAGVPVPVPPSTADLVLDALSGLDPKAATAGDVIDVVKAALVDAGAAPV